MKMPISRYAIGLYAILCAAFGLNLLFLQPISLRPTVLSSQAPSLLSQAPSSPAAKPIAALKREEKKESPQTSSLSSTKDESLTSLIEKTLRSPFITNSLPPKDTVRALQSALEARGYRTGKTDGAVSSVMQAAILAFEYDHNLPLTGEPQPSLLDKVLKDEIQKRDGSKEDGTPASATAEKIIRSVQQTLLTLGYPIETVDGRLSQKTSLSIQQFEAQQGMPKSGRISGELIVRLSRLANDMTQKLKTTQ